MTRKMIIIAAALTVAIYHAEGVINGLTILPLAAVGLYLLISPSEQRTTMRGALDALMEADDVTE